MLGVLAEDKSDVASIIALLRRLLPRPNIHIQPKAFGGGAELVRKGARILELMKSCGCNGFVICHDADGPDPEAKRQEVHRCVVRPAQADHGACVLIPVQEIEAWVLADTSAISAVIPTLKLKPINSPEQVRDPKERLRNLSRKRGAKPLYVPAIHNAKVLARADLEVLSSRCPSFRPLAGFARAQQ